MPAREWDKYAPYIQRMCEDVEIPAQKWTVVYGDADTVARIVLKSNEENA